MLYELEDTSKVKHLFEGWDVTLIYSCLQKVMGKISGYRKRCRVRKETNGYEL